ncbi:MAG: dihydrodipicolinate synthase family protein [Candidatus Omnitrophota bacterium]|nr:dihydrodipicolinate synthase family protein [Candidatus Omnitrophota bacterium]
MINREKLCGIWSAAPTPLTEKMEVDVASVERMVEHHLRLGINGLFLLGTNGEGLWLPERHRRTLVRKVVEHNKGKMLIAVQVTDNSAMRMLENVKLVEEDGADIAVIAPPYFLMNATPKNICALYLEVIGKSSLPIGIYDRGSFGPVVVPDAVLKVIYGQKKVILVKDSSTKPEHRKIALAARKKRPELRLLNGWEFNCIDYLKDGYDGLLLGGGVFNGYLAGLIMKAVKDGDLQLAQRLQDRMNRIMWAVYGGKKIKCWLAGEKELLVKMGIFRTHKNFLNYAVTKSCDKAIERVLERDRDVLLP